MRAPLRLDSIFIEKFLREKSDWITKNQEKILRKPHKNYSEEDILDMKKYTYHPFEDKKSINYTFDLSRWIDDRVMGMASADLGVRVILTLL